MALEFPVAVAVLVSEKQDGKPCVTSLTIFGFKKTFAKRHPPLNRSLCQRPENNNVK